MLKKIIVSSFVINVLLILGKLSGFIREILVANVYGVSKEADIVVILLTLPDIVVALLVGGAISSAFIPIFSQDKANSEKYALQASLVLFLMFFLLSLFLIYNSSYLFKLLSPVMSDEVIAYNAVFLKIVICSIPISVITSVYTAYLQSHGKYLYSGLNTLVFNACIVISLILIYFLKINTLYYLSVFILLATCIRFYMQYYFSNISFSISKFKPWLVDRSLIYKYTQAMGAGCILVLYPIIVRTFISTNGEGYIAMFNYGMRLIELPQMLSITFITTLLLPKLSSSFLNDSRLHAKISALGFQAALSISFILATILYYNATRIIGLIFPKIQGHELIVVSEIVSYGSLGIFFHALNTYMSMVCFSQSNTHRPVIISTVGLLILVVALLCIGSEADPKIAMLCLVFTYAICLSIHILSFDFSKVSLKYIFNNGMFFLSLPLGFVVAKFYFNIVGGFHYIIYLGLLFLFVVIWLCFTAICHAELRKLILEKYFV